MGLGVEGRLDCITEKTIPKGNQITIANLNKID